MSLTQLWKSSRDQLEGKGVQQIIAFAGEGKLRDGNDTSDEFRDLLGHVPSELLVRYADECLMDSFKDSGLALQDIVNQVGRRLGFQVEDGRYRGSKNRLGHDGLWKLPDGHSIVVEVKTTDAYRIDLDKIAAYRKGLVSQAEEVHEESCSLLIIVGRKDTGDLEAQVRGSRHAWDMRLISVDALLRLMKLKEALDDPATIQRTHAILIPREFTKLDDIVELVFSTAEEVKQEDDEVPDDGEDPEDDSVIPVGPKFKPVKFNDACVERIEQSLEQTLVKRSRSTWSSPDNEVSLVCAVSKEHTSSSHLGYWFAFHPSQQEFLAKGRTQYVAFGCGSEKKTVLIPFAKFQQWLEDSWTTERDGRFYWHVQIRDYKGQLQLALKKGVDNIDVTGYLLPPGS